MAKQKRITIETLAQMMAKSFEDLEERFNRRFEVLFDDISLIKDDIKDIKGTMRSLVLLTADHEKQLSQHNTRISNLEDTVY